MRDVEDEVVCARVEGTPQSGFSLSKHSFDLPLVSRSQVKLHCARSLLGSGHLWVGHEQKPTDKRTADELLTHIMATPFVRVLPGCLIFEQRQQKILHECRVGI